MRRRYPGPLLSAFALLFVLALPTVARAVEAAGAALRSPGGQAGLTFSQDEGGVAFALDWRGRQLLLPSPLGMALDEDVRLGPGMRIVGLRRREGDERYRLVAGKHREARDHYRELELDLADADGRRLGVIARAYDDGVALRYRLPRPDHGDLVVRQELTGYLFADDYRCWSFNVGRFNTPHEGEFDPIQASRIRPMHLIDLPLVCEAGGGATFAIAEADLDRYAAFYLSGRGDGRLGLDTRLSPRQDTPGIAVRLARDELDGDGHLTPWRVVMLGDRPGDLVESNLISHLNPPTPLADTSWIVPGKSAWDWWSGSVAPDVAEAGMNTATMRRYIDHAADMGLDYMLIDAGWYPGSSGGDLWDPSADASRPVPGLDLPALLAHARERGVGIWLWVHFRALDTRMDELFARYRDWGVKGVKVDYMDRNDQEMVAFFHRMMRSAAGHRLMLDLHGAYRPTGLNRTWPHFLTQEGVLGAEYNKWSRRVTPTHNVTIPFTRMLVGPIDYTPGGFRNSRPEQFQVSFTRPQVMGSRAHQLAMFVVYDSPLQMVADSPEVYIDAAGADFIGLVPTSWDETRVLDGAIGEYIVLARRHGADWYIGAMGNEAARTLDIDLSFLGEGPFEATLWQDGAAPVEVRRETRRLRGGDTLRLALAEGGGGAALRLVPVAAD